MRTRFSFTILQQGASQGGCLFRSRSSWMQADKARPVPFPTRSSFPAHCFPAGLDRITKRAIQRATLTQGIASAPGGKTLSSKVTRLECHIHHHANMMNPEPQLFTQYPGVESIAYYRKGGFHPIHIDDVCRTVIALSISSAMAPSGLLTISPRADAPHLKFLLPMSLRRFSKLPSFVVSSNGS